MLFVLIILLIISCLLIIFFKLKRLQPFNQTPLDIETFDGSNSPYHPSVLYFPKGWNGWKYWMAETPFYFHCKPYRDRNECPSIHVSNDGYNWVTPQGCTNPIVNFDESGEKNLDYYSDPHLVFKDNKIECWYRLTERQGNKNYFDRVSLRRIISSDGVVWNNEEIISQLDNNIKDSGLGKVLVSPAIIHEDGRYKMWYVDSETGNSFNQKEPRNIVYSESIDGKTWSKKETCSLTGIANFNPWHIDVVRIDGIYYLTVYGEKILRIFSSTDGLKFSYKKIVLEPAPYFGSFYAFGLYRSCLIKTENTYKLYFSADDGFHTHIGLMEGIDPLSMVVKNVKNKKFINILGLLNFYLKKYIYVIKNIFKIITNVFHKKNRL